MYFWEKLKNEMFLTFIRQIIHLDECLKKRWKIIEGKCCLVKTGSSPFMQHPFNEAVATMIAKR